MKNQNPILHTPEGVRDIYGSEFVQKFELQQLLYRVLAGQGYQGIETPTFEFFDVFSREVGTVPSRELYKFFDKEGNIITDGDQVEIGGNDKYVALCRNCWRNRRIESAERNSLKFIPE